MKNIFVDTNIIIDLLTERQLFSKMAVKIFDLSKKKNFKIFISSHTIAATHYILKKYIDDKKLRLILLDLLNFVSVIVIDDLILKTALKSNHKDFEDGIQILVAQSNRNIDCIVTRNIKDFKLASINVYTPDEFLNKI